jgi:iron complex outermembrane receptor protein/outer membrane receptor for ferrienterochelin and colicins
MNRLAFVLFLLVAGYPVFAQHTFNCVVRDSSNNSSLPGATVALQGTANGAAAGSDGSATLHNIPAGTQTLVCTMIGYKTVRRSFVFPLTDATPFVFMLVPEDLEIDEVVIASTRTNSRIDDLNTKVEVLGQDDMDEESTIVPGSVTSILGDLSVITIQRTSPVNGNDAIRMQGLDARYTQLMRDGLPLYGGFSGSLGVLAIPPLDLKQVEIIKGSASTLYGGGAIGGLINFISKTPSDTAQTVLTANATTLREYNLNVFTSKKNGKCGLTLFGGANIKSASDVNGDGITEVPEDQNFSLHPRLFFDFSKTQQLVIGFTTAYDNRKAGDKQAVLTGADTAHPFLESERTFRNTADLTYTVNVHDAHLLTFKTAGTSFRRSLNHSGFLFDGTQQATYSEFNDYVTAGKHHLVFGGNFISDAFRINSSDTVAFSGYTRSTAGVFVQDEWQLTPRFSVQGGMRADNHSRYGLFLLPRISFFYKAPEHWSLRLAGGSGYKVPDLFDFTAPNAALAAIPETVLPEKSYGSNADLNYHTTLAGKISLQVNQAFYYTHISNPVILAVNSIGQQLLQNGNYRVNSYGSDTYVRLTYEEVELYAGYNHTESRLENSAAVYNMPFNPKDKFSTTLAYEIEKRWRMGVESSLTANQFIANNERVHNLWFMAAMIERKFRAGSIVLNCENLLDTKQADYEALFTGPLTAPVFRPVWGPLEGRVVNLSLKIAL